MKKMMLLMLLFCLPIVGLSSNILDKKELSYLMYEVSNFDLNFKSPKDFSKFINFCLNGSTTKIKIGASEYSFWTDCARLSDYFNWYIADTRISEALGNTNQARKKLVNKVEFIVKTIDNRLKAKIIDYDQLISPEEVGQIFKVLNVEPYGKAEANFIFYQWYAGMMNKCQRVRYGYSGCHIIHQWLLSIINNEKLRSNEQINSIINKMEKITEQITKSHNLLSK